MALGFDVDLEAGVAAASLVTGPIETMRASLGKRSPSASVRLRTVEDEVKVT